MDFFTYNFTLGYTIDYFDSKLSPSFFCLSHAEINLDIQAFAKVSDVDLGASDVQGWTVIHHVVSPMAIGTYDNVLILKLLVDAGADINAKDKAGLAPLDYALIRGAPKLAKALQTLMEKPQDKWVCGVWSVSFIMCV